MDNVVLETLVQTAAVVTMTEAVAMDPRTVDQEIALQTVGTPGSLGSSNQGIESDSKIGDATALCGKDSAGGKVSCPLNVCCSYYGYCGVSGHLVRTVGTLSYRSCRPTRTFARLLIRKHHVKKGSVLARLFRLQAAEAVPPQVALSPTIK